MNERSYVCACGGRVAVPPGSRRFTLDEIRSHHDETCPARGRSNTERKVS